MVEKNIERLWNQLLTFIKDERVIPIIGPELLKVDIDGETHYVTLTLRNNWKKGWKSALSPRIA
jgi:hypothetical protein